MSELTVYDLAALTQGMTDQQKFYFNAQYAAARKDRTIMLVISIFVGHFGIDRFLLGDIGLGLLKLFTFGVFGIFTLIDWFLIMGRTDDYNRRKAHEIAAAIRAAGPGVPGY